MTKTQTALLAEARRQRGHVITTVMHGKGCNGLEGMRRQDAACKLRDAGLLEFVKHDRHTHTDRGWSTYVTDTTWQLVVMV